MRQVKNSLAMAGHSVNGSLVNMPFMELLEDDFSPVKSKTNMKLS